MKILDSWDEHEKASAVKIAGLVAGAAALFFFIAAVSYLFHWQEDMSLPEEFANRAGRLGYKAGRMLVCDLFGVGSLALPVILAAVSLRLLGGRWHYSLIRTTLVLVFGAAVSSFVLDYSARLLSATNLFGGGLGGRLGAFVVTWSESQFGVPVTGLFIIILILCFLVFSSERFCTWLSRLGDKPEAVEKESAAAAEVEMSAGEETPVEIPAVEEFPPVGPEEEIPAAAPVPEYAGMAGSVEDDFEIIKDEGLDTEVREPLKPIDNRLDPPDGLPDYRMPSLDILEDHSSERREVSTEELTRNRNKIKLALKNYRIEVNEVKAIVGPTVTLYKVYPAPGVQIAQIKRLQEDIALTLNAKGVRVVTLSDSVGIEVANDYSSTVPLKALLNDPAFRQSKFELPVAIGYTITQKVKVFDLSDAPHLLIAGATKQGKSVGLNVIVSSLLYSKHPSELKFVFIDPKMVEFSSYGQLLKHYLAVLPDSAGEDEEKNNAIVKNPKNAEKILRSLCTEMDDRYELLSKAGVNKITLYNEKYKERHLLPSDGHRYLPYLVCVVDEYADLTMTIGASPETRSASKSITNSIIRLAQKGRAAGIHVILATQRPSVDVISGIIKSNFPMRIAFRVASRVDSMTILDAPGAERLIGRGDMLFSIGIDSERIQCGYVSGDEIEAINRHVSAQTGVYRSYNTPYYLPMPADANGEGGTSTDMSDIDERFAEAANLVVTTQKASTSFLQTRLGMGFAKAARVMGQLESAGIVGPQDGAKPRQVLVPDLNSLQPILDSFVK